MPCISPQPQVIVLIALILMLAILLQLGGIGFCALQHAS